jgi:hypothetical protein
VVADGIRCPAGWNGTFNENCYYVSTQEVTQATARSTCESYGAELTSIESLSELYYIGNISYDESLLFQTKVTLKEESSYHCSSLHTINEQEIKLSLSQGPLHWFSIRSMKWIQNTSIPHTINAVCLATGDHKTVRNGSVYND